METQLHSLSIAGIFTGIELTKAGLLCAPGFFKVKDKNPISTGLKLGFCQINLFISYALCNSNYLIYIL